MRKTLAAVVLTFFLGAGSALAAMPECESVKKPWGRNSGFLVGEDGRVAIGSAPLVVTTDKGSGTFRICIPLTEAARRAGDAGAVNIKIQFYTPLQLPKPRQDAVEYENLAYQERLAEWRMEFTRRGQVTAVDDRYPATTIDNYQRFHGCDVPYGPLATNFHMETRVGRTDAGEIRRKFVFRRDEVPLCNVFAGLGALLGRVVAPTPLIAGNLEAFVPQRDLISRRRSVLVGYDLAQEDRGFLSYDVKKVVSGTCLRIEVSQIFDSSSLSQQIGIGCIGAR